MLPDFCLQNYCLRIANRGILQIMAKQISKYFAIFKIFAKMFFKHEKLAVIVEYMLDLRPHLLVSPRSCETSMDPHCLGAEQTKCSRETNVYSIIIARV